MDGRDRSIGSTGGRATSGAPAGSTSTWGGGLAAQWPPGGLALPDSPAAGVGRP